MYIGLSIEINAFIYVSIYICMRICLHWYVYLLISCHEGNKVISLPKLPLRDKTIFKMCTVMHIYMFIYAYMYI
jgi:hypothetical protein